MKKRLPNVAVIGATGAVGSEVLKTLEKRQFPLNRLDCFSSPRSQNEKIFFREKPTPLQLLSENLFRDIDLAIFCGGAEVSKEWIPKALSFSTCVVDTSSAFRMKSDVPLIIPEINSDALEPHHRLAASPNCTTTIMLMGVAPLHRRFKAVRIVAATYQAASGAGIDAMRELKEETFAYLENRPYTRSILPHPYAFNLFPHDSALNEEGYVEEEIKMVEETRKILKDEQIGVHATCVRVPVLRAHSEALNISFAEPVNPQEAYALLREFPGISVFEDWNKNRFPMPSDATFCDEVLCGRIRKDPSFPNTLGMWVVGDQLLKGAALNAVQIAELFLQRLLI